VTVVGDDKQSIYRWRDARVQNLREFAGKEHFLRTNHRSTQNILDLAHHFIVGDPYFEKHAEDIRLEAFRGASSVPVCIFHPPDESPKAFELEAKALAAWILSVAGHLGEGVSPFAYYRATKEPVGFGDIAVLMRSLKASSGLPEYERVFRQAGIPYTVSGGGGSLEVRALERLRDLLRLFVYPGDMKALLSVLENKPFSLSDASLKELFEAADEFDIDAILSDEACGRITDAGARESCAKFRALVHELRVKRLTLDLPAFVSQSLEAGPFFYHLFGEGADDRLVEAVLEILVDIVDRLVERNEANLAAFVEALGVVVDGKALEDGRGSTFPAGRVQIMTVHSAKGLQFAAVAVPGIKRPRSRSDGFHLSKGAGLYLSKKEEWGRGLSDSDTYEGEETDNEQEERCLLYVAMTRAKDHLFVSSPFPKGIERGKDENLFNAVLGALRENRIPHDEVRDAPEIVPRGDTADRTKDDDRESLISLVETWRMERQRLDAARIDRKPVGDLEFVSWRRLHTFEACPLMYYYRYVAGLEYLTEGESETVVLDSEEADEFSGDVRLPRDIDRLTYGSFVHRLLFEWMSPGPAREVPREKFVDDLAGRFGMSASQRTAVRETARDTLDAFAVSDFARPDHVEALEVPVEARIDKLVFRGTIDRIDRVNGCYRIIDYKGKMPRDEYAYQLRFYAWILRKAGRSVWDEPVLCYLTHPIVRAVVDASPARLDEIERDALRLESAASEGRFEPTPGLACEACPFGGMCPHACRV
jgi:ATP-dependent exoDNAse (exonuclease V) beta subunit